MLTDRSLFYQYLAQTSPEPIALEIVRAKGLYLYDAKSRKYMDFISGISVSNVGHRHPQIVKAIQEQLGKYMHLMVYGEYIESPQVKLAEGICRILPSNLNSVYFVNSGAEAIEGAMKLAKRVTGRNEIIACKKAYHGSTQGALSLMGDEKLKVHFRPLLPGIGFIKFNDEEDLIKINSDTAAVIVESIQGEAGIVLPQEGYLQKLDKRCREKGVLLIIDEIQTGMGRTGKMFGFENFGISPDIITLAKAFGGGMPLGAFIASKEMMHTLAVPALGHITTFGGHPMSCAAGLAALNILKADNILKEVETKGALIKQLLDDEQFPVYGIGLFIAKDFKDKDLNFKVIKECLKQGLITDWFLFADNKMRICPPLTISEKQITTACRIIRESVAKVTSSRYDRA